MKFGKGMCILAVMVLLIPVLCPAQDTSATVPKFGAFGLGSSDNALIGWAALGIPIANRVISYTDMDVGSVIDPAVGQFELLGKQLQYSTRTGFAYKIYDIAKGLTLWGLGDAGIATSDRATVGSFEYGGFVDYNIKGRWGIMAILCAERNSVTGTTFAPRFGVRVKL